MQKYLKTIYSDSVWKKILSKINKLQVYKQSMIWALQKNTTILNSSLLHILNQWVQIMKIDKSYAWLVEIHVKINL